MKEQEHRRATEDLLQIPVHDGQWGTRGPSPHAPPPSPVRLPTPPPPPPPPPPLAAALFIPRPGTKIDPVVKRAEDLDQTLADLTAKLDAANMQRDVFTHMIRRLEVEGVEIQKYVQYVQNELRKGKGDVPANEKALYAAKQELKDEEAKFGEVR